MSFADPGPTTQAGPKPPPTVMRGPAHADNYRVKVGRYGDRWYTDPLPDGGGFEATPEAYPSVSIVKGASGKDWSYVTMKRLAHADDLTELIGKGFYERYERFKVINQLDLSAAQRRGTNVHTWAECIAYGVPQYLPKSADGSNYFPIVDKLFDDLQPKLLAAEFVCIDRSLHGVGYGGTGDGIFEIEGGRYMVDWKSRGEDSDHGCYPEEAGQIGGYAGCEYIIVEDDDPKNRNGARRDTMPKLDGGLIISIKPDSYEVYPIDLKLAVEHWRSMHHWWVSRRTESKAIGKKWAPRRKPLDGLEEQLQASLDMIEAKKAAAYEERKESLYARYDKLTKAQQAEFDERFSAYAPTENVSLDNIEGLLDDIVTPTSVLDMAKARMAKDAQREADRRLADEGGEADNDDVVLFTARWELGGLTDQGKRWVARLVTEAIEGGVDFRLSALNSQRRADIYNALTEWAAARLETDDEVPFRAMLFAVGPPQSNEPLGVVVGKLLAIEAAALRVLVTEIVEGRWTLVHELDGGPHWEPNNTTTSERPST